MAISKSLISLNLFSNPLSDETKNILKEPNYQIRFIKAINLLPKREDGKIGEPDKIELASLSKLTANSIFCHKLISSANVSNDLKEYLEREEQQVVLV